MAGFEDRIAAYILAVLYTHYHLDFPVHQMPLGTKPSQTTAMSHQMVMQAQAFSGPIAAGMAHAFGGNPDIGAVHHTLSNADVGVKSPLGYEDSKYKGSEVYENCVAVIISGNCLYMAINFKVRRNANGTTLNEFRKLEYSGFGDISASAMDDIVAGLSEELRGVVSPTQGRIQKIRFIAPIVMPANEQEAAAFHAEMQLVSYMEMERGEAMFGRYIGVNKACCANCTDILTDRKVQFAGSHDLRVTNWRPPSSMRAMMRMERDLA